MADQRPNILFFMCDQLTPGVTSPYREGMAITPTFQKIADRGVTFTSAYCNNPLCTPSRASMMSGQYGSAIGVYHNAGVLHSDEACFTHHLRAAGYHTVLSGKMHFIGPDQMHGFSQRLTTDIYPAEMLWIPDWSTETPTGNELPAVYESLAPLDGNKFQAYDEEATFQAVQWLRHYSRSEQMRRDPFFLCVSLTNPHHPYVAPTEHWALYDDREIPPPTVPPRVPDNYNERWLAEALTVDAHPVSAEDTLLARRGYFACTSFVDGQLAKIVHTLETLDLSDDTWVVITSDHGDMIGERGLWFKKLFHEHSARVPLIISPPGGMAPQRRSQPVSLVDLFPTFTDIGRTPPPEEILPGSSLLPMMEKADFLADRPCIMEYMGSSVLGAIRMVRQGAYKYVSIHPTGEHEQLLFNLEDDPDELQNLAACPELAPVLERLRGFCVADGWDGQEINRRVRADQRRRRLIRSAMTTRPGASFRYIPPPVDPCDPEKFGLKLNDFRRRQEAVKI